MKLSKKRVVVTGMGAVSPYGRGRGALFAGLRAGASAVSRLEDLDKIAGLDSRLAGRVRHVDIQKIPRQIRRSMSPMSAYAYLAALEALQNLSEQDEELDPAPDKLPAKLRETLYSGHLGIVLGSTLGSPATLEDFFRQYLAASSVEQMKSMQFFRSMSHTAAANLAQALGVRGRVLAPCAACATGCQAIGLAYENIAWGRQEAMLCGGADEYHPLVTGTFDLLHAASTAWNDAPGSSPRPFDLKRDGVVCAEGAGILLLESLEKAEQRGAAIQAEILGFASCCDSGGLAEPSSDSIAACMAAALQDADLKPSEVAYVNAHATGTELGDAAEAQAIAALFGQRGAPVSSLKGHMGHAMAASGALESIAAIDMLNNNILIPTRNLDQPDPRCAGANLLQDFAETRGEVVLKNSFALGGINCSLVLRVARPDNFSKV